MPECTICGGSNWVCEEHPDKPWDGDRRCCGAPGVPCQCNPSDRNNPPRELKGFKVCADKNGYRH